MNWNFTARILCLLSWCLCFIFPYNSNANDSLSFGIVPQQSAQKLARKWAPILSHLSNKTGYKIIFKTAPSIPIFESRCSKGEYDIAYMNPYHYVVFSGTPGYMALAKQKNKEIKGIIVVRKDSPYAKLEDLEGKTLAFPAPAAFAASLLTRAQFKNSNINITPKYVKSHDSVYITVARGLYPAGGGVVRTLKNMDKSVRDQLRILWTTKGYTPHAIATHPNMQKPQREKVLKALLSMNDNPQAQPLLESINFNGFEAAHNKDWDDVRALHLEALENLKNASAHQPLKKTSL